MQQSSSFYDSGALLAIAGSAVTPIKLHPEAQSELADEALYGSIVKILAEEKEGWYPIETHYGYKGYVKGANLIIDTKQALQWVKKARHYIMHPVVDVLAEPKYASYPLITLTRGAVVCFTGEERAEGWIELELPDGQKGWIRKGFLVEITDNTGVLLQNEEHIRKSILETAFLYMGIQYRWGGKSTQGIDCSGLSSMAYILNGIMLPRDADQQEELLKRLTREESKPGDLLFFPGHVAIYIGEDRYIHATGRDGMVTVNSFNKAHEDYREDLDKNYICTGTIFR